MSKNNGQFPYPVLTNDNNSAYKSSYYFELLDPEKNNINDLSYEFYIQVNFNCPSLENLLEENKCNIYYGYKLNGYRKLSKLIGDIDEFKISIPIKYFSPTDTIHIYAYIIAEDDMLLEYNNEMLDDYNLGDDFPIKKKDIIGISNEIEYFYNRTGDSFIQFNEVADENVRDFDISLEEDDYIIIKINHKFNENYAFIRNNPKKGSLSILNSSIIYFVLQYSLTYMCINGYENHLHKRWFKIMKNSFSLVGINLVDFLSETLEEKGDIDISKIYEYSQKVTSSCLGRALEIAGKEAKQ